MQNEKSTVGGDLASQSDLRDLLAIGCVREALWHQWGDVMRF